MKEIQIDNSWLTKSTGDPFADVGGLVIKYLQEQTHLKDKSILELIEYVTDEIYIKKWGRNLYAFFLNSKITQGAKGFNNSKETKKYFKELIENEIPFKIGYCRISGRKTNLFRAGRDNHILSGSGTFVNYHHNFDEGVFISKEMLIRMFFVPLGVTLTGDKLGLIQSNNQEVSDFFIRNLLLGTDGHFSSAGTILSKGVIRYPYTKPSTALFGFASQCISELKIATYNEETEMSLVEGININLYHFTNYGTEPNIELYNLPAILFKFFAVCSKNILYKTDWELFIDANYIKYYGSKVQYEPSKNVYLENVKEVIEISSDLFVKMINKTELNFNLSSVGSGDKTEILNRDEFERWKQKSKMYSEWQKSEDVKIFDFKKEIKVKKEDKSILLVYKKEDFSKKWNNIIYEKLLKNESIVSNISSYLRKRHKTHSFNLKLLRLYTINLRNMKSTTLDLIEKIADEVIKDESNLKRNINRFLSTSRYDVLRSFIIQLIRKNHKDLTEKPLITLEEYTKYLFIEGGNWREIRDLLLICTYQKMHEQQIFFSSDEQEEGEDEMFESNITESEN